MTSILMVVVALLLCFAGPAFAQSVQEAGISDNLTINAIDLEITMSADARTARLIFLNQKLTQLKQEKVKAVRAHDAWLNAMRSDNLVPKGLHGSGLFRGREEWSEALRTIWHISDQVYPGEAGPALMTSPPGGLSEAERSAHRRDAMPEIEALEKRITDEIATLKTQQ